MFLLLFQFALHSQDLWEQARSTPVPKLAQELLWRWQEEQRRLDLSESEGDFNAALLYANEENFVEASAATLRFLRKNDLPWRVPAALQILKTIEQRQGVAKGYSAEPFLYLKAFLPVRLIWILGLGAFWLLLFSWSPPAIAFLRAPLRWGSFLLAGLALLLGILRFVSEPLDPLLVVHKGPVFGQPSHDSEIQFELPEGILVMGASERRLSFQRIRAPFLGWCLSSMLAPVPQVWSLAKTLGSK